MKVQIKCNTVVFDCFTQKEVELTNKELDTLEGIVEECLSYLDMSRLAKDGNVRLIHPQVTVVVPE